MCNDGTNQNIMITDSKIGARTRPHADIAVIASRTGISQILQRPCTEGHIVAPARSALPYYAKSLNPHCCIAVIVNGITKRSRSYGEIGCPSREKLERTAGKTQ